MRKLAVVAAVVLLFVTVIAAAQSEKSESRVTLPVHLNSRPDFAEVRIDGAFVGTAPLNFRLTPGVHKIEFTRSHFQTWSRDLLVTPDNGTNVIALLEESSTKACPSSK
jgi:hypothetical protein